MESVIQTDRQTDNNENSIRVAAELFTVFVQSSNHISPSPNMAYKMFVSARVQTKLTIRVERNNVQNEIEFSPRGKQNQEISHPHQLKF
jgi:hypothetical protein